VAQIQMSELSADKIDERMNKVAHTSVRIRFIHAASIVSILLAIGAFFIWTDPFGCSSACAETVKSEEEAKAALAAFFTSRSRAANALIESLRKDGMTDDHFAKLQSGCRSCYVYRGNDNVENSYNWYVATSIAPQENKKMVVLEIECKNSVLMNRRLYGG
jgi:hypothetical protein